MRCRNCLYFSKRMDFCDYILALVMKETAQIRVVLDAIFSAPKQIYIRYVKRERKTVQTGFVPQILRTLPNNVNIRDSTTINILTLIYSI